MVSDEYVSSLVVFIKASPLNKQLVEARVQELFSQISLYQGKDLVSFSQPGQHIAFSRSGNTIQEEFAAVTQALAIANGQPTIIRNTYPLFF